MFCGTVAANTSPGPAPNSGDGVPDGSGFEPTILTVELVIILLLLLIGLLLMFFLFKRRKKEMVRITKKSMIQIKRLFQGYSSFFRAS